MCVTVQSMNQEILPRHRARLAAVMRAAKHVISLDLVEKTLGVDRTAATKMLARWGKQGWLRRVGRGLYVPVPLDLAGSVQVVEDPWVLVPTLFGRCYVGGWTAAHHWDLTEQLFGQTVVFTTRRVTHKHVNAQGATFLLHHISEDKLFGEKAVWRGAIRVNISDPARTLVDMLAMPEVGGGIDHVADCIVNYFKTASASRRLVISYAERFGNGAIFKRLGFLAETLIHDKELAAACRDRLTQGYAQLDPSLPSARLVTTWRLWIPQRWMRKVG